MSYLDKIKDNKQLVFSVIGGLTAGYILFKLIKGSPKQETPQQRRKREIEVLRRQINVANPSFQDVKKVIQVKSTNLLKDLQIKQKMPIIYIERMKYTKITRKQNLGQYLKLISDGMQQMQMIAIRQQEQLLRQLGINEIHFKKYQNMLGAAMEQIMRHQSQDISHITPMKLQDAKFAFRQQIDFIKNQGLQYAQLIIDSTKDWARQKKAGLPMLLSMLVTDSAFQGYPLLDQQAVQHAQTQYQKQLMGQMQQLQVAMTPMMLKLNSAMKEISGFDFADFNGMGAGEGFTPEQLRQLHELERLQIANQAQMASMLNQANRR